MLVYFLGLNSQKSYRPKYFKNLIILEMFKLLLKHETKNREIIKAIPIGKLNLPVYKQYVPPSKECMVQEE